jgi:hypothetical protein
MLSNTPLTEPYLYNVAGQQLGVLKKALEVEIEAIEDEIYDDVNEAKQNCLLEKHFILSGIWGMANTTLLRFDRLEQIQLLLDCIVAAEHTPPELVDLAAFLHHLTQTIIPQKNV